MRSLDYTREKLWAAVAILAGSTGTVQQRLANAYESQLIRLTPDDMPMDMRETFAEIEARLTAVEPVGDEGRAYATTAVMDEIEAALIAESLVSIYGEVC